MASIAEEEISETAVEHSPDAGITEKLADHVDDGSSSGLSDPDDRTGNEDGNDGQEIEEDVSDADDTEAETERLEETPQKQRNVLLTPLMATIDDHGRPGTIDEQIEDKTIGALQEPSNSSPEETSDDGKGPSTSLLSRKRKRSEIASSQREAREGGRRKSTRMPELSRSPSINNFSSSPTPIAEDQNQIEMQIAQPVSKQSHKKGKRKGRKVKENDTHTKDEGLNLVGSPQDMADNGNPASSNEDDLEMEDGGERDGADVDNANKTEEDLAKKKTAMDSLSAIELYFATYRDKLFDERLTQCNDELAMLEQPTFDHPELLLMKEVIDRRRNQKIQYEQTLLKFKLKTLQRESIANKAQIHAQYMIEVGEIRDSYLSQNNAEIYQTQRERRNGEGDMPDFMYAFNPRRSKQITDQTAYNEEISLLSGIAKYVGFPAAPDVIQIRSNEWEEDQRIYQRNVTTEDESNNARRLSQHHPPTLRASLSAASTFGRPQPAAEDKFLQQNAWANPQHPAHQKHRQASGFSQVATPSTTPANQARVSEVHGSASTIPDHPSAANSSVLPTPATEEVSRDSNSGAKRGILQNIMDATPSRVTQEMPAMFVPSVGHSNLAAQSKEGQGSTPFTPQTAGRENYNLDALPNPLSLRQEEGSISPPPRNMVIKAEEPVNAYGHAAAGQQNHGPAMVSTASTG